MNSEAAAGPRATGVRLAPLGAVSVSSIASAVAVSAVYLAGMKVGSLLKAPGQPISALWPANALLMAALIIAPRRLWLLFLTFLLPAHLVFQRQLGAPLLTSLGWFVGNTGEALLGAALLLRTGKGERPLETVRGGIRFVLYAALAAPLATTFWDAGMVVATGAGSGFWGLFATRLLSDVIAVLLFVPPFVLAFEGGLRGALEASARRKLEGAAVLAAALLVYVLVDSVPETRHVLLIEVYAPLPALLWAAWRFGPFESSLTMLAVTLVEIWRTVLGRGPFSSGSNAENVLSLQAYSATVAIPLLLFALAAGERRRAAGSLARNQERLELALAVSRLANWDMDLATGEVTVWENQLGFRPVPLDPSLPRFYGVVHSDDREALRRAHDTAVREGGSYEVECRVYDKQGNMHWVLRKAQVIRDREGRAVRVHGVTRDITRRKQDQEALADAQRIAVLARNAAKIVIWSVNLATGEVYTEPGLTSLLGFEPSPERSTLEFWLSRIYEADRIVLAAVQDYLMGASFSSGVAADIQVPELEYRMLHADGTPRWFLTRATVERNADGSVRRIVGTAMDVTRRKAAELEAEERQREMTRLARVTTLGEISAALAHELSQPLTSILSNAQAASMLLARDSADLAEIGRILEDITSEDRRAGEVIRHLRNLLRKGSPQLQELDVNAVAEEILRLMRGDLMTRGVTVRTFLDPALPTVRADPVEIQQVFLNLLLNACDAMEGNAGDERVVTLTTELDSSDVVVAVSDVGSGIRPEWMGSLFKPFFTTKAYGIGMGLPICHSILAAVGGRVWVENNPERGCTFRFSLPAEAPAPRT
ncbi:MAG TPA: PAS domain-containing protein [Thermoanaerobaculia bacterium]|nr:PAS domain-containing protein [Thermoanaerobaculia bacterium]